MSIQRWDVFVSHDDSGEFVEQVRTNNGDWVTCADHLAEVERVQEATLEWANTRQEDYNAGAEAMRAACIAELEAQRPYEGLRAQRVITMCVAALREVTP